PHFVRHIFPTGIKPVFRLRTKAGYEVRITGDHKVLTVERGDVRVNHVWPGEHLRLQGAGFGRRALPDRIALALGASMAGGALTRAYVDGEWREIVTITVAPAESAFLQGLRGNVEPAALPAAVGVSGFGGAVVTGEGRFFSTRVTYSRPAEVEIFKEHSTLAGEESATGFTPAVFDLDGPSLAALLRGLFTAEGSVAADDEDGSIVLESSSLEILRQTQMLLLNFGIRSEVRRGADPEEASFLAIRGYSRVLFERAIGFHYLSPKAETLRSLNEESGAQSDVMIDAIESIEADGSEPVFDLTEPITHHFAANGLVVHNCSEYMFLDDTACNLASLNLMKFHDPKSARFDVDAFRHAIRLWTVVLEISVLMAQFPSKRIADLSWKFRTVGLGYANLGTVLMVSGIPYDSDQARGICGAITGVLTGHAYATSAEIAAELGAFPGYEKNKEPMLRVIRNHRRAAYNAAASDYEGLTITPMGINPQRCPDYLLRAAREDWDRALLLGERYGFRNAQTTVIAPTGTIGLLMDCDTTGIEPDFAL
ncbi:MAG TPA: LAGLIDADG family homing endonuclease, partial [Candidatus Dormibacteraeota bacterium]|nr:LAGLIDADG family homing endonuclease [Candidatus Dormibacteraeota bacterium]